MTIAEEGCARILNHRKSSSTLVQLCKALGADESGMSCIALTCWAFFECRVTDVYTTKWVNKALPISENGKKNSGIKIQYNRSENTKVSYQHDVRNVN